MIHFICSKVLIRLIFKYPVRLSVFVIRLFRTDNGMQCGFCIHIFVYSSRAVIISPARQINGHGPVCVSPVMAVIDVLNLFHGFRFLDIVIRLAVFPVVIAGVWV